VQLFERQSGHNIVKDKRALNRLSSECAKVVENNGNMRIELDSLFQGQDYTAEVTSKDLENLSKDKAGVLYLGNEEFSNVQEYQNKKQKTQFYAQTIFCFCDFYFFGARKLFFGDLVFFGFPISFATGTSSCASLYRRSKKSLVWMFYCILTDVPRCAKNVENILKARHFGLISKVNFSS